METRAVTDLVANNLQDDADHWKLISAFSPIDICRLALTAHQNPSISPPKLPCPAFPLPLLSIILHPRNLTASSCSKRLPRCSPVRSSRGTSPCLSSQLSEPILLNLPLPFCSQGSAPLIFHGQSWNWVPLSLKAKKQEFLWTCECAISRYLWFPHTWCPIIQCFRKPSGSDSTYASGCLLGRHHGSKGNRHSSRSWTLNPRNSPSSCPSIWSHINHSKTFDFRFFETNPLPQYWIWVVSIMLIPTDLWNLFCKLMTTSKVSG